MNKDDVLEENMLRLTNILEQLLFERDLKNIIKKFSEERKVEEQIEPLGVHSLSDMS